MLLRSTWLLVNADLNSTRGATTTSSSSTSESTTAAVVTTTNSSRGYKDDHKPVLPLTAQDVIVFILAAIILMLAAGAGIGGGVLLVPLLSLLGGFHFIEVVALSNVTIFAGAITNMFFNVPRRNPTRPGPLIDYDLLLLFGPPIVIGSVAGSKLNYFIPSWITKMLVLVVLAPTAWRMVLKARLLWMAESKRKRQDLAEIKAAAESPAADVAIDEEHGEGKPEGKSSWADDADHFLPQAALYLPPGQSGLPHLKFTRSLPHRQHHKQHGRNSAQKHTTAQQPPITRSRSDSTHARSFDHHLAPLSEHSDKLSPADTTDTDLVSLLGPELMLLRSPAAATATLQVQRSARQLSRQASSLRRSRTSNNSFSPANSGRAGGFLQHLASLGVSRAGSIVSRAPSGAVAATGSASFNKDAAATAEAVAATATNQHADGSKGAQDDLAAGAPSGCADSNSTGHAFGHADHHPANTAPAAVEAGSLDGDEAGEEELAASGFVSPFQLHQRELMFRQDSILRQHSMRRAGSILQRRHSSLAVSAAAAGDKSGAVDVGDAKVAAGAAAAQDAKLPLASQSRCRRLVHDDCCHSAELEEEMRTRMVHHITAQYPKSHIAGVFGMLLVVVVSAVCGHTLLECGTWEYWLVILTPLPAMALIWAAARWHVLWRLGWMDALGISSMDDIHWTPYTTLVYPALCTTVGLLAGLLGLGGGVVMAPVLLELGIHPATSAASSQAAMLISACTSSIVYLVNDAVPMDWGTAFALIGFTATLLGQTVIITITKRTGRCSLLVFILAFLFVLAFGAGVAVIGLSVVNMVKDPSLVTYIRKDDMCIKRKRV